MEKIKPEGKLTVITDYGEGLSKAVDGVSMDTVWKLKSERDELFEAYRDLLREAKVLYQHSPNSFLESTELYFEEDTKRVSRIKDGE